MDAGQRQAMLAGLETELARNQNAVEELNDLLAAEIKLRKQAERLRELAERKRDDAESAQQEMLLFAEEVRRNSAKSNYEIVAARKALETERRLHENTRGVVKELEVDGAALREQIRRANNDLAHSEGTIATLQGDAASVRHANSQIAYEMTVVRKERDAERQRHGDTHTRLKVLEDKLAVEAGQRQKTDRSLADAEAMILSLKGELAALRQK